jgi:hypothetical protein
VTSSQIFHPLEIDNIELRLSDPIVSDSTIEELYRFGALMFAEIQQRGSETDRKLANLLGWSIASLGFVVLKYSQMAANKSQHAVLIMAMVLSLACVVIGGLALLSKMWQAPSEDDWFKEELWDSPSMLRRYHVVSMLSVHQTNARRVAKKADCLGYIEVLIVIDWLLILSGILFF